MAERKPSQGQGLSQGMGFGKEGCPQTATHGPTVVPPCFMPQWAPNFVPPQLRGIFKEEQSLPDSGTEDGLGVNMKPRDVPRPTACPPSLCLPELMSCLCLNSLLTFPLPRIPYLCLLSPWTKLVLSWGEGHCPLSPGKYWGTSWFPGSRQQDSL